MAWARHGFPNLRTFTPLSFSLSIYICNVFFYKYLDCKSDRPKKKKLKVFQGKLEDLVDQIEIKKQSQPDLDHLQTEVEKCLDETSKQVREINKATVAVGSHKKAIENGKVVLSERY